MGKPPQYPKGDLRRMLSVLGAIDAGHNTLVQIVAATGLDKRTVTALVAQARAQAFVSIAKDGPVYRIEDWGPVLKRDGARKALTGALNTPTMTQQKQPQPI
ncbi:MAG: winged helix-turn-helix domain-containing protein [Burkholderiales bacterium]|nr:winged helix-turn-helix domain-containing protein [Burkholderiales bacterium]